VQGGTNVNKRVGVMLRASRLLEIQLRRIQDEPEHDIDIYQNVMAVDAPSDDFDGNSRPQGAGYDIGAFEFMGRGVSDKVFLLSFLESSCHPEERLAICPILCYSFSEPSPLPFR